MASWRLVSVGKVSLGKYVSELENRRQNTILPWRLVSVGKFYGHQRCGGQGWSQIRYDLIWQIQIKSNDAKTESKSNPIKSWFKLDFKSNQNQTRANQFCKAQVASQSDMPNLSTILIIFLLPKVHPWPTFTQKTHELMYFQSKHCRFPMAFKFLRRSQCFGPKLVACCSPWAGGLWVSWFALDSLLQIGAQIAAFDQIISNQIASKSNPNKIKLWFDLETALVKAPPNRTKMLPFVEQITFLSPCGNTFCLFGWIFDCVEAPRCGAVLEILTTLRLVGTVVQPNKKKCRQCV